MEFTAEQIKVLLNAWKADRYIAATHIAKGTSLLKNDVDELYKAGFLRKRKDRYRFCPATESILESHGFDLSVIQKDPPPAKLPAKQKEDIIERAEAVVDGSGTLKSYKGRQELRYALALKHLEAGNPIPMVRLQWPDLIIHDPLERRYFEQYCDRTEDLDVRLDDRQIDLIKHCFDQSIRRIGIKGSTSPGKGFATALAINLWYTCFPDSRVVLIGPSVAHSKNVMFAEVAKWRKKMTMPGPGEILTMGIKDPADEKHVLYIANPDTGEGLSGAHGAHVLFIFDESSCHDADTEVLTDSGWKLFADLSPSDQVLTLDRKNNTVQYETPVDIINEPYSGPMYLNDSKSFNFCVTPNHRMLLQTKKKDGTWSDDLIVRADQARLSTRNHRMFRTIDNWHGQEQEFYRIPALKSDRKACESQLLPMDLMLKFLGIFMTDGTFSRCKAGRPYSIRIIQKKKEACERIENLISQLPWEFSKTNNNGSSVWICNNGLLASYMEKLVGPRKSERLVPSFIESLSKRQIRIFLDWYGLGDGANQKRNKGTGSDCLYTQLKNTADNLQILALKAGFSASITRRALSGKKAKLNDGRVIQSKVDGWQVHIREPRDVYSTITSIQSNVHYDGTVHCVTMPNHDIIMTRRHGRVLWSGNSLPEDLFTNSQKQATQIICISNPRILSGWFYDMFPRDDPNANQTATVRGTRIRLITFGGKDCINVKAKRLHVPIVPPGGMEVTTVDGEQYSLYEGTTVPSEIWPHVKALIPGQMDYQKYIEIMARPSEIERAWSGEGHFPPEDADLQVIPPSWLREPCKQWADHQDEIEITAFGLDLAASIDKDQSVLAAGGPKGIRCLFKTRKANSMDTLSWMIGIFEKLGINPMSDYFPISIDCIGAGGNVMADLLEENGASVIRNLGNKTAIDNARYMNRRAELYGQLADRLNPESDHLEIFMIPEDGDLKEELSAHEKVYSPDGIRFRLTPKQKAKSGSDLRLQSLREKLGRSPDSSDAAVLCYDAIRYTEDHSSIGSQFDPSAVVTNYRELFGRRGGYEIEHADGHIEYSDEVPAGVISIEDMQKAFENALHSVHKDHNIFGLD